jgi:hypothetical protein
MWYAKIYGIYKGTLSIFVVTDHVFLKEVFIKRNSVFYALKVSFLDSTTHNVCFISCLKWRFRRHVINPISTARWMEEGKRPLTCHSTLHPYPQDTSNIVLNEYCHLFVVFMKDGGASLQIDFRLIQSLFSSIYWIEYRSIS